MDSYERLVELADDGSVELRTRDKPNSPNGDIVKVHFTVNGGKAVAQFTADNGSLHGFDFPSLDDLEKIAGVSRPEPDDGEAETEKEAVSRD